MGTLKVRYRVFKKGHGYFIYKSNITIKNKTSFADFFLKGKLVCHMYEGFGITVY